MTPSTLTKQPSRGAHQTSRRAGSACHASRKHSRGLLLIGLFKLGKSIFFFLVGIGALKLLHKDLGDLLLQTATDLKFDTESRFITVLLEKAQLLNDHRLMEISIGTFCYSGLALLEGIGLLLEKTWAEYFTLILSISFLPWEFYELVRDATPWRAALTASNILIVVYLIWFLRQSQNEKRAAKHS